MTTERVKEEFAIALMAACRAGLSPELSHRLAKAFGEVHDLASRPTGFTGEQVKMILPFVREAACSWAKDFQDEIVEHVEASLHTLASAKPEQGDELAGLAYGLSTAIRASARPHDAGIMALADRIADIAKREYAEIGEAKFLKERAASAKPEPVKVIEPADDLHERVEALVQEYEKTVYPENEKRSLWTMTEDFLIRHDKSGFIKFHPNHGFPARVNWDVQRQRWVDAKDSGGGAENRKATGQPTHAHVPPPESTIDVGEGYERLKVGTVIDPTDQFRHRNGAWLIVGKSLYDPDDPPANVTVSKSTAPIRRKLPAQPPQDSTLKASAEAEGLVDALYYKSFDYGHSVAGTQKETPAGEVTERMMELLSFIATLESAAATWEKLAVESHRMFGNILSIMAARLTAEEKEELRSIIARIDAAKKEQSNG